MRRRGSGVPCRGEEEAWGPSGKGRARAVAPAAVAAVAAPHPHGTVGVDCERVPASGRDSSRHIFTKVNLAGVKGREQRVLALFAVGVLQSL